MEVMIMEITYDDWKKLDIRIGEITEIERIPKTEKLYKLKVQIGEKAIQIVTSLVPYYREDELQGRKIAVLTNLKPTKFAGEISEGMLLCAEKDDGSECVILTVEDDIDSGVKVT